MGGLLLYVRLAKAINKGGWLEVGVRVEGGGVKSDQRRERSLVQR